MNDNDDTILEFLAETGAAFSKRGLEINMKQRDVEISYSTIKRRFSRLEDAGLIECIEEKGGYYQITDTGEEYLEGEVEAKEIEIN